MTAIFLSSSPAPHVTATLNIWLSSGRDTFGPHPGLPQASLSAGEESFVTLQTIVNRMVVVLKVLA